jgi:hypothetical protein
MTASDIVAILGAVAGLIAAIYWYLASKTPVKADWDYDPKLKPKNMVEDAWGLANALERAFMISSSRNVTAAIWTAISMGLSAISVIISKWHLISN